MRLPTGSLFKPKYKDRKGVERESTVWWCQYYVNGKRHRISTDTTEEKEAAQFLRRKMADAGEAVHTMVADRVRMPQVFDLLEADWKAKDAKSLGDLLSKSAAMRKYWGDRKVKELGSSSIASYISHLRTVKSPKTKKPLGPASINRFLAALKHALNLAHEHEPPLIARVPTIKMLKEPKPREGVLTHEQYCAVRDLLPSYARVALVVGYHTGARRGEILGIRKEHIDLKAKRIRIPDSKSGESRYLPIYGDMAGEIEMAMHPKCPWLINDDGVRVSSWRKSWKATCTAVGVTESLFHDLRRTATTNMIDAGFSEKEAMEITGHKTRSVFDRYHIVSEKKIAAMAERLEAHLESKVSPNTKHETIN